MAINFDKEAYDLMEKPVILAISSCRVTKYGGKQFKYGGYVKLIIIYI